MAVRGALKKQSARRRKFRPPTQPVFLVTSVGAVQSVANGSWRMDVLEQVSYVSLHQDSLCALSPVMNGGRVMAEVSDFPQRKRPLFAHAILVCGLPCRQKSVSRLTKDLALLM
jgi:hypothetical protein